MMCTATLVLLAFTTLASGMRMTEGDKKLLCQLQSDNNLECNIRQTPTGKNFIQESENLEIKTPMFICKGPSCIMKFLKGIENMKRIGGTDKKETTFYSGW